jgi:hypothetical protein
VNAGEKVGCRKGTSDFLVKQNLEGSRDLVTTKLTVGVAKRPTASAKCRSAIKDGHGVMSECNDVYSSKLDLIQRSVV